MARATSRAQRAAELTSRGLVARQCGERMAASNLTMDRAETLMLAHPDWLTDAERGARSTLLPATWLACWRAGWRSAEREGANHGH